MLHIQNSFDKDAAVLKLNGVLDIATIDIFNNCIQQIHSIKQIIIDFNYVEFIDSTGIGSLAQAIKNFNEKDIEIKIINIPNDVFEVFEILGLPEIFGEDIFENKKG